MIRRGLALSLRKQIAFGIFLRVTHGFESLQATLLSSSGYSVEDVISNVLSFYGGVNGYGRDYLERRCGPIGRRESLTMYDAGCYEGCTWAKYMEPRYFPTCACVGMPRFPPELKTIIPEYPGMYYAALADRYEPSDFEGKRVTIGYSGTVSFL